MILYSDWLTNNHLMRHPHHKGSCNVLKVTRGVGLDSAVSAFPLPLSVFYRKNGCNLHGFHLVGEVKLKISGFGYCNLL